MYFGFQLVRAALAAIVGAVAFGFKDDTQNGVPIFGICLLGLMFLAIINVDKSGLVKYHKVEGGEYKPIDCSVDQFSVAAHPIKKNIFMVSIVLTAIGTDENDQRFTIDRTVDHIGVTALIELCQRCMTLDSPTVQPVQYLVSPKGAIAIGNPITERAYKFSS